MERRVRNGSNKSAELTAKISVYKIIIIDLQE